jgi:hypothetical protein
MLRHQMVILLSYILPVLVQQSSVWDFVNLATESPWTMQSAPVVNCCIEINTTLNNGYLGSRNDEERSEMRYLV